MCNDFAAKKQFNNSFYVVIVVVSSSTRNKIKRCTTHWDGRTIYFTTLQLRFSDALLTFGYEHKIEERNMKRKHPLLGVSISQLPLTKAENKKKNSKSVAVPVRR